MSFFAKLTSLFSTSQSTNSQIKVPENPKLESIIQLLITPVLKFDIKQASDLVTCYFYESDDNINVFFASFSKSREVPSKSLIQLFSTIHRLYQDPELQLELAQLMRDTKFMWFQKERPLEKERLKTQPCEPYIGTQQNKQQSTQVEPIKSELSCFAKQYHTYLQRLCANLDLFKSLIKGTYPYISLNEYIDPKLMFLWHYKMQNILNTGLELLQHFDILIADVQKQIWNDLYLIQMFISKEIYKISDNYAILPNSDSLSLYEIYSEALKHFEIMKAFKQKAKILQLNDPACPLIQPGILQDFLAFASKLKLLNQFTFKKSIKVPNKENPCMGVAVKNPKALHVRSTSSFIKQEKMKKIEEAEMEVDDDSEKENTQKIQLHNDSLENLDLIQDLPEANHFKKSKKFHFRGLSTFQNQ